MVFAWPQRLWCRRTRVSVSGHYFWEKTSNGCKNYDDTFKHNEYDFYAVCRSGYHKNAEFLCKGEPAKLSERKCADRIYKKKESPTPNIPLQWSSGKPDKDSSYYSYYYVEDTTAKKSCYDCQECMRYMAKPIRICFAPLVFSIYLIETGNRARPYYATQANRTLLCS